MEYAATHSYLNMIEAYSQALRIAIRPSTERPRSPTSELPKTVAREFAFRMQNLLNK